MQNHNVRNRSGGLTFIELLIVLFIVGMGWFTLVPNLDLAGDKSKDKVSLVNALIYEARTAAVTTDTRQFVYIDFNNGVVVWKDEEASLPAKVSSGHFNEEPMDGDGVEFTIYPEGFSDEVRLVLTDGLTLVLDPLSVRLGEL